MTHRDNMGIFRIRKRKRSRRELSVFLISRVDGWNEWQVCRGNKILGRFDTEKEARAAVKELTNNHIIRPELSEAAE